jgi:8-oxo-dGTP pyrophosphatase MutT (NUDIX family)
MLTKNQLFLEKTFILFRYIPERHTMNRDNLIEKLTRYTPSDTSEKLFKQEMLTFLAAHPDCFERALEIGHFTGSAWLENNDGSKALLMLHTKLDRWMQLGGHCDGDSDVLAVALKEAQEESGIMGIEPVTTAIFDIDVHLIPASSKHTAHYHYDVRFLLRVTSDEDFVQNSESKELRWIGKDPEELPTNSTSVTRMFHKWLARKP